MKILAVIVLILLHGPDGHEIRVNMHQVTSLHASKPGEDNKLFTDDVKCIVGLADGKFVSVVEPCHIIHHMLEEAK